MLFLLLYQYLKNEVRLDKSLHIKSLSYPPNYDFWERSGIFRCTKSHLLWSFKHTRRLSYLFLFVQQLNEVGGGVYIRLFNSFTLYNKTLDTEWSYFTTSHVLYCHNWYAPTLTNSLGSKVQHFINIRTTHLMVLVPSSPSSKFIFLRLFPEVLHVEYHISQSISIEVNVKLVYIG